MPREHTHKYAVLAIVLAGVLMSVLDGFLRGGRAAPAVAPRPAGP